MTKPTKWLCAQQTRISLGMCPVWSVFAVHMKAWVHSYPLSAQRRLWSDWVDAHADLSLCWAHKSFYWFCHEVAQILIVIWNTPKYCIKLCDFRHIVSVILMYMCIKILGSECSQSRLILLNVLGWIIVIAKYWIFRVLWDVLIRSWMLIENFPSLPINWIWT